MQYTISCQHPLGVLCRALAFGPDGGYLYIPFGDGVVRLGFPLQQPGSVRLTVVDLLGREIAVLIEGRYVADVHTATWDPLAIAPGVYLVRLTVDGRAVTQPFTLLRWAACSVFARQILGRDRRSR